MSVRLVPTLVSKTEVYLSQGIASYGYAMRAVVCGIAFREFWRKTASRARQEHPQLLEARLYQSVGGNDWRFITVSQGCNQKTRQNSRMSRSLSRDLENTLASTPLSGGFAVGAYPRLASEPK